MSNMDSSFKIYFVNILLIYYLILRTVKIQTFITSKL